MGRALLVQGSVTVKTVTSLTIYALKTQACVKRAMLTLSARLTGSAKMDSVRTPASIKRHSFLSLEMKHGCKMSYRT